MNIFAMYYFYFIVYSFLGWVCETTYCSLAAKKFINRGFLVGPFCPIYGTGAVLVLLLLKDYKSDLFVFFGMSILIAAVVEYLSSYLLEKIFNLSLWDYSKNKFNLNGRICVKNLLLFALLCLIIIYVTDPILENITRSMPTWVIDTILIVATILFSVDAFITSKVVVQIKKLALNHQLDLEEMTKVRDNVIEDIEEEKEAFIKEKATMLEQKASAIEKEKNMLEKSLEKAFNGKQKVKYSYKRLLQAFPKMKMPDSPETIKKFRENLKKLNRYRKIKWREFIS